MNEQRTNMTTKLGEKVKNKLTNNLSGEKTQNLDLRFASYKYFHIFIQLDFRLIKLRIVTLNTFACSVHTDKELFLLRLCFVTL